MSTSLSDAVTLRVQDAFTRGGAQVAGGRSSKTIEFADNLDFALGKRHALRAGPEGARLLCCCAPPYRHEDPFFD